jgi:2,4-dienoyl-CoA reductase-like NADH-dependent reductase (Old Yellow Enzyme family)
MEALEETVGEDRLAIRLTPFGLYNETRGMQRVEIWGYLCRQLKSRMSLRYMHFIEPRYEQVLSVAEKDKCKSSLQTIFSYLFR